jgi:carboxypeptidase Taq
VFRPQTYKNLSGRMIFRRKPVLKLPAPVDIDPHEIDFSKQSQQHPSGDYMTLKMRFRDIGRMNGIIEALGRDFLTAMPEGAYRSRLGQISFLARRMHEDLACPDVAAAIENAQTHQRKHKNSWDEWDRANLFEMENMYRHHCQIAPELMEQQAYLTYEGRVHHRNVLLNNDWESAKKFLRQMIDLQRRVAESKCLKNNDHKTDPLYQALLREYIPGGRLTEIEKLFGQLKTKIDTLVPQIEKHQASQDEPLPLVGPFSPELQLKLNKSLLHLIGFDFNRGGLYETGHNPVEGGTPDDTRLVIKTSLSGNFLDSMKSALHEGGHGLYIQGLPRAIWRYQPVGQDLGAAMQESQALLVEMVLGRMPEFFEYLSPRVEGLFQKFGDPALSAENLYKTKTRVRHTMLRRQSDEVTYFYHIHMRMQLERDLIAGRLDLDDLPDAWNAKVKEFTGQEPQTLAEGCLQDVHWFVGKFAYFPSYTLGHMMAAQFYDSMKKDIQNIPDLVRRGEYGPMNRWLADHIHSKGRLQRTDVLLDEVTGGPLKTAPLVNHLQDRYLAAA